MIVGEAPGKREDASGVPFIGRAGQLLDELLEEHGIGRKQCFITNAVSCRPPGNKTPTKGEIKKCKHWLELQIKKVKPKYVLLLGNVPLISVTGKAGIKKMRGRAFELDGITYLPTFHPAFILRDDKNRPQLEADVRFFAEIVKNRGIPREEGLNHVIVDDKSGFQDMLDDMSGLVSFDVETTGLYPWDPVIDLPPNPKYPDVPRKKGVVSLGIGTRHRQWCLPLAHPGAPRWRHLPKMIEALDQRFHDCEVAAQFGKFDCLWMRVMHGVRWYHDFDTGLAHYLLNENMRHGLKLLAQVEYGAPDFDESIGMKTGAEGSLEDHCYYLAHDLYYTRKLRFTLGKRLRQDPGVQQVFDNILMPCSRLFTDIEHHGVYVDRPEFKKAEKYLLEQIAKAEAKLKKIADINWGSTQQVAKVLYGKFKLPVMEKTKTGAPSTGESALNQLDHPVVKTLLEFRGHRQQYNFFIKGWKPFLVDGRMHPSFKLHGAVTGRPSCEHPNLQQVPRDSLIRSLITAPPGWVLVEGDLSQIEMRIAGELSGDPTLLRCFNEGIDVHWQTAVREMERGGAEPELVKETAFKYSGQRLNYGDAIEVIHAMGPDVAIELFPEWKELRKKAKAVNFGYLFGMWWKKFKAYARDNYGVIITDDQARESREAYFELYDGLPGWHERQRRFARRNGYVRCLSGRKRRLPDALSPHDTPARGEALRQAINSPVQGFASELNLMVALQMAEEFSRNVFRPIGTVHDSMLAEVRKSALTKVCTRWLQIMEGPAMLERLDIKVRVPLRGDVAVGPWSKGKTFHAVQDQPV